MSLDLERQPDPLTLATRREPQVCYVLLTLAASGGPVAQQAVNWALVADASRSMRIPIIDEEQFRALVRSGGAHEVLIDGVPVWQFSAALPPEIDTNAPNALSYVARALHSIVEHLHASDRFALVACAEQAVLLAPGTSGASRALLQQSIGRLKGLHLGDATDLSRGMRLALEELRRSQHLPQVRRLLLLTDGFTQHADTCLELARQAAAEGISVSTLGLGGEFQEDVLTSLADVSGGRAIFLRQADEIPQAVAHELAAARAVAAQSVTLEVQPGAGVTLRRASSITPVLAPLETARHSSTGHLLRLGDLEQYSPTSVLLEFLAPPGSPGQRLRLARLRAASDTPRAAVEHEVVASYTSNALPVPAQVLGAAARANAVRLQRRALEAAASGDQQRATSLLRSVTARLHELGEHELASIAQQEADTLERTGHTSRLGAKELTYSTRRLGRR